MSSVRTVTIRTDGSGNFTHSRALRGRILAIEVLIGDLSTPDIDVTDDTYSVTILSVDGVAADTVYRPSAYLQSSAGADTSLAGTSIKGATAAVCMGNLKTVVTGAGANKVGHIKFLYD